MQTVWLWAGLLAILFAKGAIRMREWGFWEWLAYACIGVAAVALALDQAAKGSPPLASRLQPLLDTAFWHYIPLLLVAVSVLVAIGSQLGLLGNSRSVREQSAPENAGQVVAKTELRLQFYGDFRIPLEISSVNVATWYAYYNPAMKVSFRDEKGNPLPSPPEFGTSWAIFIVLDKPSPYRQAVVTFSNQELLPRAEVKLSNSRAILASIPTQIPAGVLQIETRE